ncbi:uncharacterized protein LOC134181486 [Corticium candelabrum]|uniref:uncharacterized protein LOC134181486 n=1 Tax=Corticium candelabrum TaxID=121492 RepID=UPI002E25FA6D|nr:uncharacterized protein LOC134181486 [Corticium candelabrum]
MPSDISAVDYNKDGRVSYHEFVVAMTLDENNSTSRDAFHTGGDNADGTIDKKDFDRAVGVTMSWLFKQGDGEEGEDNDADEDDDNDNDDLDKDENDDDDNVDDDDGDDDMDKEARHQSEDGEKKEE